MSYPDIHYDVKIGNKILIDDGKLEVQVIDIKSNREGEVEVTMGGILSSK